jgi:hypothetical protein
MDNTTFQRTTIVGAFVAATFMLAAGANAQITFLSSSVDVLNGFTNTPLPLGAPLPTAFPTFGVDNATYTSTTPYQSIENSIGVDGAWNATAAGDNQGGLLNRTSANGGFRPMVHAGFSSPPAGLGSFYYSPESQYVASGTISTTRFHNAGTTTSPTANFTITPTALGVIDMDTASPNGTSYAAAEFLIEIGPDEDNLVTLAAGRRSVTSLFGNPGASDFLTGATVPDFFSRTVTSDSIADGATSYATATLHEYPQVTFPVSLGTIAAGADFVLRYSEVAISQTIDNGGGFGCPTSTLMNPSNGCNMGPEPVVFIVDPNPTPNLLSTGLPQSSIFDFFDLSSQYGGDFLFGWQSIVQTGDPFTITGNGTPAPPFVDLIPIPEPTASMYFIVAGIICLRRPSRKGSS